MDAAALKSTFSGNIILPEDKSYEQVRNSLFSKGSPAFVLQPRSTADVVAAVNYARDNKYILSVRSGGHSNAGHSTNMDGVVIDLSLMATVEILDKEKNLVRIEGGAKWIDIAKKLSEYGLAISSGDTKTVGVGGLTLGGGIGWMVRKYGLTIDSLVGAEVVTADGKILRATTSENSDLFWAIRGGGGNFGVITSFEFEAHRVQKVVSGTINYGIEDIPGIIKGWRDAMRNAPEELTTMLLIMPSFGPEMPAGATVLCCYAGEDEIAANIAFEPLTSLGKMIKKDLKIKEYYEVLEDAHPPEGVKIVVNNLFFKTFSDEVIAKIAAMCEKAIPIIQIRSLGGAMKRVPAEATAFANRDNEVLLISPIFLPADVNAEGIEKALLPWEELSGYVSGSYVNFLTDVYSKRDIDRAYPTATFAKLLEIKKKYDPENLFNQNFNIK